MRQQVIECFPTLIGDVVLGSGASNRYVVNIGANDGVRIDETWHWMQQRGWPGMAVEAGPKIFEKLKKNYAGNAARLFRRSATPETIVGLLQEGQAPKDMFLFKIDIDGYDLRVLEAVLLNGYVPLLVFCEHNEKIPPPFRFFIDYNVGEKNEYVWSKHIYGASAMAIADVMRRFNYKLLGIPFGNNMVWARSDLVNETGVQTDDAIACAYFEGYYSHHISQDGRKYRWNRNVDSFLDHRSANLTTRAAQMRTTLLEISRHHCLQSRRPFRPADFCSRLAKAPIQWPTAPPDADADFVTACDRIKAAPRVRLIATKEPVADAVALGERSIPLAETNYTLSCQALPNDYFIVDDPPPYSK